MSGLQLSTGLGASVFTAGYPGGSIPAAATASPQGPTTVGQKAFGIVAGDSGASRVPHLALLSGGGLALAALVFIWWSLPR